MDTLLDRLLDDEYRERLFLYQVLMIYGADVPKKEIAKQLDSSDTKIDKLCDTLNRDLASLSLPSKIKFRAKETVYGSDFSQLDYQELRRIYFENSLASNMLMQVGFLQTLTIQEFAKVKYISKSKAYMISKNLNELLTTWSIQLKSAGFSGAEKDIRSFCFQVTFYFYSSHIDTLPSLIQKNDAQINQFINSLQIMYNTTFSYNQLAQLRVFIEIQWFRLLKKEIIHLQESIDVDEHFVANFKKIMQVGDEFPDELLQVEATYLYLYLLLNNFIQNAQLVIKETETYQLFSAKIVEKFPTFFEVAAKQTLAKLRMLCFRWDYLSLSLASFMSLEQFDFFKQSFPKTHEAIYDFVLEADKSKPEGLLDYEKSHLYYDFLFCILSDSAIQSLEREVHVFIDFSGGKDYNQFISMNIQSFDYLDIVIDRKMTPSTDIYISDFYSSKVRCQQIVWKNPPLASDWKEFANLVIQVRGDRSNED